MTWIDSIGSRHNFPDAFPRIRFAPEYDCGSPPPDGSSVRHGVAAHADGPAVGFHHHADVTARVARGFDQTYPGFEFGFSADFPYILCQQCISKISRCRQVAFPGFRVYSSSSAWITISALGNKSVFCE